LLNHIGNIEEVFEGYATKPGVRLNGASGGVITGALRGLLKLGLIDGAVVNVPDPEKPGCGKSIFAQTEEDIFRSAKSIYCMTEIKSGLKDAFSNGHTRIAVVGLPCQISSLEKDERIVATFGLMCGHNVTVDYIQHVLEALHIDYGSVAKVDYRGSGWFPFNCRIQMKNGTLYEIPWSTSHFKTLWQTNYACPKMCFDCSDFAAESADIACCDAWLDEHKGNADGISIVLSHTKKGTSLIETLRNADFLTLQEAPVSVILRAQAAQIRRKMNRPGITITNIVDSSLLSSHLESSVGRSVVLDTMEKGSSLR